MKIVPESQTVSHIPRLERFGVEFVEPGVVGERGAKGWTSRTRQQGMV